jgi:arylsulfatase A
MITKHTRNGTTGRVMKPTRILLMLLALAAVFATRTLAADRPNILLVLSDDLGYADLACFGHPRIKTPNLDKLANEGMRLTACYSASAVCSPSRTALMTGRTPCRVGIHRHIPWGSPMHVQRREITIARLLRDIGYATCHVGKWHMNGMFNQPEQPQPGDHGFDYWFSTQNNALPNHQNPNNFVRNGRPVGPLEGYSSELIVAEAVRWLKQVRPKEKPFFLYCCFHAPHDPIATPARYIDMYAPPDDPQRAVYYGNVSHMDEEVGRLLRVLDECHLRDNTFVWFTSDNGPEVEPYGYGSAAPFRERKCHLYEGGIRVPGILRWPGRIAPGSTCDEPVCGVDFLPTVCAVTGAKVPQDRPIDGASILPILAGRPIDRRTPLYWQYNYAPSQPKVAMRIGDWKLLGLLDAPAWKPNQDIRPDDMRTFKTSELSGFELYNLRADPSETTDLAQREPQTLKSMSEQLRKLYREVRDESPSWPQWTAPNYEGERIRRFKLKDVGR